MESMDQEQVSDKGMCCAREIGLFLLWFVPY